MIKGMDFTGVSIVFACHDGRGNFLFQQRTDKRRDEHWTWDNGAGGLRFGEKVEDAIRREIKEEFCTDVLDVEFLGYRDVHREHEGMQTHWIGLDFKILVDRDKVRIGEPHKQAQLKWTTIDNLPEPLHSCVPLFFTKYRDLL